MTRILEPGLLLMNPAMKDSIFAQRVFDGVIQAVYDVFGLFPVGSSFWYFFPVPCAVTQLA